MSGAEQIDPDVRQLVVDEIQSVAQLELLLLLHQQPQKSWTAAEAAAKLCTAADMTAVILEHLRRQELVQWDGDPTHYIYAPRSPDRAATVDKLARLYHERRVSVITLIYSKNVDKLQSFADAFRFRRKEGDK